jgi:hypothetical protein
LLKRIILGKNMTDNRRRIIRDWCRDRVPELLVVEESENMKVQV